MHLFTLKHLYVSVYAYLVSTSCRSSNLIDLSHRSRRLFQRQPPRWCHHPRERLAECFFRTRHAEGRQDHEQVPSDLSDARCASVAHELICRVHEGGQNHEQVPPDLISDARCASVAHEFLCKVHPSAMLACGAGMRSLELALLLMGSWLRCLRSRCEYGVCACTDR